MSYFPGAQRRGNSYYFVASKDDCGWQLLQQRGNSSSSAELTAGSFTFGLTSREETCWVSSLLEVILQFQSEAAKCYSPESWAEGWCLRDRLMMRAAVRC